MYTWFTKIWQVLGKDNIFFYEGLLLKRSFAVLFIQFAGLILAFGSNLLLARLFGEKVYGIYSLVSNWAILLSVVALFGMDDAHLVRIPTLKLKGEKTKIRAQLKWSLLVNSISISLVAIIFFIIINFSPIPGLEKNATYFNYSLLIVCFLTIMTNLICFLRGLDKVILGEIMDKIARPAFLSLSLLIFFYLWKNDLAVTAIFANGISLFCVVILLAFAVRVSLKEIKNQLNTQRKRFSLRANTRYTLLNLVYLLSTRMDILLLGLLSETIFVGHYNVATRIADIFSYPIAIINLSLPTLLSRERDENGNQGSPYLMYRVSKNSFVQCLIIGVFFIATGYWILGWYGSGFTSVFPVLSVFFLSTLISAFVGSIDMFFILEGQEKKVLFIRIFSLIPAIAIAFLLIPIWKTMGAAISMLIGNLIYCSLLEFYFFKIYGIFIHPFTNKRARIISASDKII